MRFSLFSVVSEVCWVAIAAVVIVGSGLSSDLVACPVASSGWQQDGNQDQWSRWRGPTGNGIADSKQKPPTNWGPETNVVWRAEVPGRGHSSPIVLGDKIFLTTAVKSTQTQSVLCYDRKSGKQLWKTDVNRGGFPNRIHGKNTHASPTVATDGQRVFAVFNHHGAANVAALDLDGKIQWTKSVGPYKTPYGFGFGASPIVYQSNVLVTNENQSSGGIIALDTKTGQQNWKIDRNRVSSYSTPVINKLSGNEQLLISGGKAVRSYNPGNGKENWSAAAKWIVTCGTMVWDGDLVFASGGFPVPQTIAVSHKTGNVVWSNQVKSYEQSMLAHDGYLYAISDRGAIYCWRAADGREMWKTRFRGPVSASPTLVDGNIHFTAEDGQTMIVKCDPDKLEVVAENQLGDSTFASPAFCGNQMFTRVGENGKEFLYCIGKE